MTQVGTCLTAKGVKPIVTFKQQFKNTYLYGSFSPINGNNFVWEVNGVDGAIFEAYLKDFSQYYPEEYKIVIIDNAGFHATKTIEIPDNIKLINIPPYTPELNPSEKIWQYIKQKFKNQSFDDIEQLKSWLHNKVIELIVPEKVMSIVHNDFYNKLYMAHFN